MRRFLNFLGQAIAVLLFSAMFAVILIEWLAGCGETYVDADGVRHHYECVFIPHNPQ